jgi:hypothetical protein
MTASYAGEYQTIIRQNFVLLFGLTQVQGGGIRSEQAAQTNPIFI